jgi:hypothetical protein
MKMSYSRLFQLCLVALVISMFAVGAAADTMGDIHIHMDPATPPKQGDFNLIESSTTSYLVNWVSCTEPGFPGTVYDACIGFINQTGAPIDGIHIGFTVPTSGPLVGQTLDCSTDGVNLTANTCANGAMLAGGEDVDAVFSGGQPIPNNTLFFIGETGVSLADMANVPLTVTGSATPEPSVGLLFWTGLLMLGVIFGRRCARGSAARLGERLALPAPDQRT